MQQQRGVSQVSALMEKAAAGRERGVSDFACAPVGTIQREPSSAEAERASACLPACLLDGWMDAHAWPDLNGHVKGWRRHIYL